MIRRFGIFLLIGIFIGVQLQSESGFFLELDSIGKEESEWKRAYLASFPRSGNTWMRQLIHEATGILTTTVHQNRPVFLEPFPWGAYISANDYQPHLRLPEIGEIALVKTHFPFFSLSKFAPLPYEFAICIVRHPIDSIYSTYKLINKEKAQEQIPFEVVRSLILSWKNFQIYWKGSPNVLIIRYEDLYNNPKKYLRTVLEALKYSFTEEDLDRAISAFPPRGGFLKHLDHYTDIEIKYIERAFGKFLSDFNYQVTKVEFPDEP